MTEDGARGPGGGVDAAGGTAARAWVAPALLVSAAAYASWLLAGAVNPPLNSAAAYASELAATDQPWSRLFRGGDLLAGGAALAAGLAMAMRRPGRNGPNRVRAARLPRLGWWCVAAFGAVTMLDSGLFPMACAPSVDAACAAAEAAGTVPLRHRVHTVTSGLAAAAPLLGLLVFAWVRRGFVDLLLCGLMLVATAATVTAAVTGDGVGLAQRAQLLVVSAWLLRLAARTRTEPMNSTARRERP